ncbi:MAG: prolipoprotein diacylglyceryl transferase [Capsulimonadaceae bacterium]|nr:prolipoprotein diacylglyceryl transferase [Capsulimonadaceae bacterium]
MNLSSLAHLAPLTLSSACYAAGYATGVVAFAWMAKRRRLATSGMLSVMAAGLIGGLVCANIAQFVFAHSEGKSVLGGIAGGYLTVIFYKRHLGIRRGTGDLFAVALSAGEAVGRFGCYFGGCCYGKACGVPWAIWQHGAWRHPAQLYMAAASAVILAILLRYDRKRPPENALFFLQGVLYCASRFTIEFFRETNVTALGLSTAQWACIAGELFFGVMLVKLLTTTRRERVAILTTEQAA